MPEQSKKFRDPTEEIAALKERIRELEAAEAEHRRTEEELREKESLMRAINESAHDAIIMMDTEGRISYWNPAAVRIFGYTSGEAVGQNLHGLLAPEQYRILFEEAFPRFQRTGRGNGLGQTLRMEALRRNGEEFPIELSLSGVKLGDGWHAVGVVRDITHRVQAEETLREHTEWLHNFMNELPALVCEFLPDSTLTFVNRAYCEFFGMAQEELIGYRFLDFVPEETREASRKKYMSLTPQQPVTTGVHEAFSGGEFRVMEWRNRAFFDENGRIVKLLGIGTDITEREQTKRELQQSEERFRSYIENSPIATFEVDNAGRYVKVNKAACEMSEYTEEELLHRTFMDLVDPEYLDQALQIFANIKQGDNEEAEIKVRRKSGKRLWINLIAVSLHEGGVAFCQDVTEQKMAKEALENQLRFERVVADISNMFVRLPTEKIHEAIDYTLKQAGEFFQVGRCYVFLFSEDRARMSNTHEWCAEGVEPQMDHIQDQPIESLPWWAERIKNRDHVHVPDVDRLPPEAEAEWKEFKSQNIRSVLSIPLEREGEVFGFLGMDAVKQKKEWDENHVMLLRGVAELIANAYTRYLAEQKISYLSFHDVLTGLYNRRYLENEMERMDTERQLPISIILADLNNFKLINDVSGHRAGDELLEYTAEILRNNCRSEDVVARWGGDEFVIFLPRTTEEGVKAIYERINESFEETYIQDTPISLALGYAVKKDSQASLAEKMKEADKSMYAQKMVDKSRA